MARSISNLDDIHSFGLKAAPLQFAHSMGTSVSGDFCNPCLNEGFKRLPLLCVIRFLPCPPPAQTIASMLLSS